LLTRRNNRYSPVGQGILTGQIKSPEDFAEGDVRRFYPRFKPENFAVNVQLVDELKSLAKQKGCSSAQLAINWVSSLSNKSHMPLVIPIPGATTESRVRENGQTLELTGAELAAIDEVLSKFTIVGGRYPEGVPIEG
jgi:pyridoxine 4-dehydrogenase